jgi:hypothetical protein
VFRIFKWSTYLLLVFVTINFEFFIEQRGWHDILNGMINRISLPKLWNDPFWNGVWITILGLIILEWLPRYFRRGRGSERVKISFQSDPNAVPRLIHHSGQDGISFVVPRKPYDGPVTDYHRRMIGFRYGKKIKAPIPIVRLRGPKETAYAFRRFSDSDFGLEVAGDLRDSTLNVDVVSFDSLSREQQQRLKAPNLGDWQAGQVVEPARMVQRPELEVLPLVHNAKVKDQKSK